MSTSGGTPPADGPDAVRLASPAERRDVAAALAAAFRDDPVFGWLLRDDESREARVRHFFAFELALVFAAGEVWTSPDRTGAALALPPGANRMPVRVALAHGRLLTRAFGAALPRATALLALMEARHLHGPHYYLPYIGVAPEGQGRGLGTALMRPVLDRADREGVPAYLEATSPRNAALYERLGFEPRGEIRLLGSPPLLRMTRPAR